MPRDALHRMDVDTGFAYHRKLRTLQRHHPERWPVYWTAYLALLGEAWQAGDRRLTLEDAWCPAVPCAPAEALAALKAARIVDNRGRIPLESWAEWYGPVEARKQAASTAANARWHSNGNAPAKPPRRARSGPDTGPQPLRDLLPPPPGHRPQKEAPG